MSDLDLTKLTDGQLGALKMVGGDLTKLPDATLLDIKSTLSADKPGTVEKIATGVNDVINTVGTGLTKGVTGMIGLPRAAGDMQQRIAEWGGEKLGVPETGKAVGSVLRRLVPGFGMTPSAESLDKTIFSDLGVPEVNAGDNPALTLTPPMLNGGKINVGKMIDAGIQAVPSMLAAPVGAAASALSPMARAATTAVPAFAGGAGSEAAGQATAGTPYEIPARVLGGVAGFLGGGKAVTPLSANLTPEEARLVALAKEKDIPLTVGQETGRGRGVESALARFPTSQGQFANFADEQATAINKDALAQAGATGERLDPTTMNGVIRKAGADFEAAKNAPGTIELTQDFFGKAGAKVADYLENTPASNIVPAVEKKLADFKNPALVSEIKPNLSVPQLTNEQYQEFRRGINRAIETTTDTGARKAMQGIRSALDDAMEAALPAEQAAAWKEARSNWANLKILTKSAAGGTVDSRNAGNLSPSALSMALRSRQGADRFASTTGGLNDTARVASYLADTIPNSGTPQTLLTQSMLTGGPIAAGFAGGGVPGAALAAGAMAAPNVMGRAMTGSTGFGWLRDYLANQAMTKTGMPSGVRSLPFSLAPGILTSAPGQPRLERRK